MWTRPPVTRAASQRIERGAWAAARNAYGGHLGQPVVSRSIKVNVHAIDIFIIRASLVSLKETRIHF